MFGRIYTKLKDKFEHYGLNDADSDPDFIKDLMEGYRSAKDDTKVIVFQLIVFKCYLKVLCLPQMLKPEKSFLYEVNMSLCVYVPTCIVS